MASKRPGDITSDGFLVQPNWTVDCKCHCSPNTGCISGECSPSCHENGVCRTGTKVASIEKIDGFEIVPIPGQPRSNWIVLCNCKRVDKPGVYTLCTPGRCTVDCHEATCNTWTAASDPRIAEWEGIGKDILRLWFTGLNEGEFTPEAVILVRQMKKLLGQ